MRNACCETNSRLPTGKGEGVASATGLAWMRLGSVTNYAQGGMKGQVAPGCGDFGG